MELVKLDKDSHLLRDTMCQAYTKRLAFIMSYLPTNFMRVTEAEIG